MEDFQTVVPITVTNESFGNGRGRLGFHRRHDVYGPTQHLQLFEEEFMKAFVKGLLHQHPELFSYGLVPLVDNYLDDIWFLANTVGKNRQQLLVAEY